ncbi:MAG: 2-oxoisovalerate dehydrogenase [Gemmatimonadetes bacterium]|nr:2-oxoisovalerate dehydrogenase [Gemmatimonadota bacterium]
MTDIHFMVEVEPDGGYTARAVGPSIFSEANNMDQLRRAVREAVCCHFEENVKPLRIHLHVVSSELA